MDDAAGDAACDAACDAMDDAAGDAPGRSLRAVLRSAVAATDGAAGRIVPGDVRVALQGAAEPATAGARARRVPTGVRVPGPGARRDADPGGDDPLRADPLVPSVAYRVPEYAAKGIDGVSIGSNDLTQLVLGVDRDSEVCSELFDESDAAVDRTRAVLASAEKRLLLEHARRAGR
jgi:hypothetical protein